jgi:hypothetical protein
VLEGSSTGGLLFGTLSHGPNIRYDVIERAKLYKLWALTLIFHAPTYSSVVILTSVCIYAYALNFPSRVSSRNDSKHSKVKTVFGCLRLALNSWDKNNWALKGGDPRQVQY